MITKVYHEWLAGNDLEKDSHLFTFYLFYFHTSHLGTYHGNGKVTYNMHLQATYNWYN